MKKINMSGAGDLGRAIIHRDTLALAPTYKREYALVVDHAQGSEIWDVDGKRYIDFMAGVAVLNVGHRHPAVEAAVREQIEKFWHICLMDFYYPQGVELAEKLQAIAPMHHGARLFFGNSGAEAVEAAIKLAMYKTERYRFISFTGAFHGRTLGALSFTASKAVQREGYHTAVRTDHIPYPNPYRPILISKPGESYGDTVINYLENEIFRTMLSPLDVAAILVEPIQGEGGYIVPAPNFFPRLRELCDKYEILLIVDEIQSGVGRTGKWWAIEHENVEPDILCFAKGIASGMPLGGIIAKEDVIKVWAPGAHGSTFGGNPVAAIAALATLQAIEEENMLEQAANTGEFIMDALCEMEVRHPSIGEVRGRGLMLGIEFVKDRETKERATELRNDIIQNAFEKGLLLIPCGSNSIRMTPPLNVPRPLVDEALSIFEDVLTAAEKKYL
ncbi:MAG: acetyl ornithine aminotransferase family protein [Ardenticatenaceae bacterium]|nr:acetyl ornithine aminotransferase family protein [Ardenticatenaceae bacterium]